MNSRLKIFDVTRRYSPTPLRGLVAAWAILIGCGTCAALLVVAAVGAWADPRGGPFGSIALGLTAVLLLDMAVNGRGVDSRLDKRMASVLGALTVGALVLFSFTAVLALLLLLPIMASVPLLGAILGRKRRD